MIGVRKDAQEPACRSYRAGAAIIAASGGQVPEEWQFGCHSDNWNAKVRVARLQGMLMRSAARSVLP
jgi:hypothetical protein